MSWLQSLIRRNACPRIHQKLALDALHLFQSPQAEGWQEIFLNFYEPYLLGAEAPDTNFRDYKNHVLVVEQNYWGGLPSATQLWYERLVLALRREFWSDAVYLAGVVGHYVADACMPLNTAQSEEAGRIQRAVEWSVSRCFDQFHALLHDELGGYPKVMLPTGRDWLPLFLRQCADEAHQYYHVYLDHFRLEQAVEDPATGFDETLSAAVAHQIGYATVAIARVLDRAFKEAGSHPPMCELIVETILALAKAPSRWAHRVADNAEEQNELELVMDEVQRTGKVIENLREDQKAVRKLFAEQVLHVSLTELNSITARPTGLYHGRPSSACAAAEDSTTRILNRSGVIRSSWSTSYYSAAAVPMSNYSSSVSSASVSSSVSSDGVSGSGMSGSESSVNFTSPTGRRGSGTPRGGRRRIGRQRTWGHDRSSSGDVPSHSLPSDSMSSSEQLRSADLDTDHSDHESAEHEAANHESANRDRSADAVPTTTSRRRRMRELVQGATSRVMTGVKSSYSGIKRGYSTMSSGVKSRAVNTVSKVKQLVKRRPKTITEATDDSEANTPSDS
ncbi:MAG: hypothetical protein ACKOU6_20500 [Planctomycetota bacterium]